MCAYAPLHMRLDCLTTSPDANPRPEVNRRQRVVLKAAICTHAPIHAWKVNRRLPCSAKSRDGGKLGGRGVGSRGVGSRADPLGPMGTHAIQANPGSLLIGIGVNVHTTTLEDRAMRVNISFAVLLRGSNS